MNRILVGVDGSEAADKALRFAAQLAAPLHAEIVVVYVVSPVAYPAEIYPMGVAELEKGAAQFGESVVRRAIQGIAELAVPTRWEVLRGPPAETVADASERFNSELVVVGSRGLGAVKRVLLGSTSDRLVHICKRPVLVVH